MSSVHFRGDTTKLESMYCSKCGKRLIDEFFFSHFEETSGRELFTVRSECIRHKVFWDGHTKTWRRVEYADGDTRLHLYYKDGTKAS